MTRAFDASVQERVSEAGVIAVLVIDRAEDAVPCAKALVEGGISVMELTLRTPAAIEALRRIKADVPEMTCGIGTILTPDQVREVKEAGAVFGVAPGFNPRVVDTAREAGLSYAPGIATPSELELAVERGCRLLKFFPAEPSGGMPYLKSMAGPYKHLGLSFVPLGGLRPTNAGDYLESPLVAAVGGSWIAPRDLIAQQDWRAIAANAREAARLASGIRNA